MNRFWGVVAAIALSTKAFAPPANRYNEMYSGPYALRAPYAEFQRRSGFAAHQPPESMWDSLMSQSPLSDSNRIFPLPLLLDRHEYQTIVIPGVRQRLRALLEFFYDVAKNERPRIVAAGIVTEDFLQKVFADQGMTLGFIRGVWEERDRRHLSALYGPDLVRLPDGRYAVMENNFGAIGGFAEAHELALAYCAHVESATGTCLEGTIPELFSDGLRDFVAAASQAWGLPEDGTGLLFIRDFVDGAAVDFDRKRDREGERLRQALAKFFNGDMLEPIPHDAMKILFGKGDFPLRWKGVLNLSPQHSVFEELILNDWAIREGVPMLQPFGTTALGHKALLPFDETFVRFYLNEEPILQTIPTSWVDPRTLVDTHQPGHVYKRANGSQGSGVHLTSKMHASEVFAFFGNVPPVAAGDSLVDGDFLGAWVQQPLVHPSILGSPGAPWAGWQTDIRPMAASFGSGKFYVSQMPWGRAGSVLGHGKNNVSQGSAELLVVPMGSCVDALIGNL